MNRRPFDFSAWSVYNTQPVACPGKIFDTTEQNGTSACPVGSVAPYGRVLIRGPQAHPATNVGASNVGTGQYADTDRYYTKVDTCCLPDEARTALFTEPSTAFPNGQTFAAIGLQLPLDDAGLLIPLGIGMWTEHNAVGNTRLKQPYGLNDYHYQATQDGEVGIATTGRIWCYTETDVNVGDNLFFRKIVTSTTDGLQLLGAFSNVGGANFQAAPWAKVYRPGPAGGAFVATLNNLA